MEITLKEGLEEQIKDSAVLMQRMGLYNTVEEAEEAIRASWKRIKERRRNNDREYKSRS